MKKFLSSMTLLIVIPSSFCIQESALFKKDLRLVNVPVAGIYVSPHANSGYDSQKIYGHAVEVIDVINESWAKVKTDDEIIGYIQSKDLIEDKILWRTNNNMQRIKSLTGCVYKTQSVCGQSLIKLPYNAYINATGISDDQKWTSVDLIDGTSGWIMTGDLEPITPLSTTELLNRIQQFVGLPYIWGGASSFGYDCSGFTQTIARQFGYPMLRNSNSQADDPNLVDVPYDKIQPGDFVYFGSTRVNHVALCIAPHTIIHSAVIGNEPKLMITALDHPQLVFRCARRIPSLYYRSTISVIDETIFPKMKRSWQDHNPVALKDLRLVNLSYWGYDQCVHQGELIVHAEVAQEVVDIFEELFSKRFPIESIKLIDEYDAQDGFSCADNNSSAFCSRLLTNSTTKWSLHSFGIAIDINTRLNPYHKGDYIAPVNGKIFLDRTINAQGLILKDDVCYNAFIKRGWKWAGDWQPLYGYVDYQHFYKEDNLSPELMALAKKYTPQLS